jgi:lipopolysaccharide transport system permease protein
MWTAMHLLIRHRRVLAAAALNEIRGRYAGTALGLAWAVLYPALFLSVYATVFTLIFNVRLGGPSTADSVLLMFAGLIPFFGFSESVSSGIGSVLANRHLVKNTLFPIELIPVRAVLVGSLTMVLCLVALQLALWWRGTVYPAQALTPVIVVFQLLFTLGVIWPLSALNVFVRDLGQIMPILLLLLMIASPIAYTVDMVPPALLPLMYANPLYYPIALYRGCLLQGTVPWEILAAFGALATAMFGLGFLAFMKWKQMFVEHV